jgi:fibronectin-binding autotransporter adhesin
MRNVTKTPALIASLTLSLLAGFLIAAAPQRGAAQVIGAWETAANGGGAGTNWTATASIWLTNTGSGYVTPGGNTPGTSYPDTNTTPITIQSGAYVTNSGALTANQLTIQSGALLGVNAAMVVVRDTATTYDWDIFGGLPITAGAAGTINLSNSAIVAVESGGAMTNFTGTTGDLFENYTNTNVLFLNGSLYVMTGSGAAGGNGTFPRPTWSPGSTTIYNPSAAGNKFPAQLTNQTFGTFIWNWPLQNGNSEPGTKFCNFTAGTFAIYSANGAEIEDVPGPGFTLTAGNILVTNALWFPAASAGTLTVNISGNFIIDHTATLKNSSATAVGNMIFDGTSPQILGIYGINGSQANFNWTVNSGATVDLGVGMTNTAGIAGGFTDNGWLDLEGFELENGTNFLGSGVVSNTVGTALLVIANGSFSGNIVGGTGVINLTVNGSTFTLTGANTYTGSTAITLGTLALSGSGSIADTTNITINANAIFNVSGLSSQFTLGAGQTLANNGSTAIINGAATTGSGTVSLSYTSGIPALIITNGALTLAPATTFNVFNTGAALAAGTYIIITNATSGNLGSVTGTLPSVTVGGGGIVAGTAASLHLASGALELVVSAATPPTPTITDISLSGPTLTITATNGADGGPYTLLESTNLLLPIAQWTPVLTNNFDGNGNLNLTTNVVSPNNSIEFYILEQP